MTVVRRGVPPRDFVHLRAVPPPVDTDAQLRENLAIILNTAIQLLDNVLEHTEDARACLFLDEALQQAERAKARLS